MLVRLYCQLPAKVPILTLHSRTRSGEVTQTSLMMALNSALHLMASFFIWGTTKADYETCHGRTGYSNGYATSIDNGSTQVGDYLCLKTGEHRYSAVRLTQLDSSKAAFAVVTYDPPGS
jgi:hypothetical protein